MFCFPLIKCGCTWGGWEGEGGVAGLPVSVTVNLEVVLRRALSVSLPLLRHAIVSENRD